MGYFLHNSFKDNSDNYQTFKKIHYYIRHFSFSNYTYINLTTNINGSANVTAVSHEKTNRAADLIVTYYSPRHMEHILVCGAFWSAWSSGNTQVSELLSSDETFSQFGGSASARCHESQSSVGPLGPDVPSVLTAVVSQTDSM